MQLHQTDSSVLRHRATRYFDSSYEALAARVDRMMLYLLGAEWIGMIGAAIIVSPLTWKGSQSAVHPHVLAALAAGPAFIIPAILYAHAHPARPATRHIVAIAQILVSMLLIDVTGGRIETHFHVFGSLAFLAYYRDWRVLLSASVLTALDHLVRGIWWPQSVYGVLTVSPWRWVEHGWWVAFEDFILILMIRTSIQEMWEVAESKARLYDGAYHDVLTGLGNRRLLQERFEAWRGRAKDTMAILFVDLDRFKSANDTLGHAMGDRLLRMVAERLSGAAGGAGTLARVGGDEFVLLLEDVPDHGSAEAVASRLLSGIAQPFDIEEHRLLLSASVGVSLFPEHGSDLAELQARADQAMYVAKSRGRNQCAVFAPEMAHRDELVQEIRRDLHQALARQEFRLDYQPLVGRDGSLMSFEALVRWDHPVHGRIAPSDFIPQAEKSGLIASLGEWVLEESCRRCLEWQQEHGEGVGVSVNVSPVQFEHPDFADRALAILQASGLPARLLTLELTESVIVQDVKRVRQQLELLRDAGVKIAIDDFGTGYSSLSYLTAIPADRIKLDRSFLNREYAHQSSVLESIINMAHHIGLSVVAEGVESPSQVDWLLNIDCDEMQGFTFSPPVRGEEIPAWVETHRARVLSRK